MNFTNWFFYGHYTKGMIWVRFNPKGSGFFIKDTRVHNLLFSERERITKGYHIGDYYIGALKKLK